MTNPLDRGFVPRIVDLQKIPARGSQDPLVDLAKECPEIFCEYRRSDSGLQGVFVRRTVAEMLRAVQTNLKAIDVSMQLVVVEGYRSPFYQERYYLKHLLERFQLDPAANFEELLEKVHQWVALPSVAGHPTGGAVDVTIAYAGKELDLGGQIADFSFGELLPTYSQAVSERQHQSRMLLHDLMVVEGFAPFYGEWWHFSYGDREWAAFYGHSEALYGHL